MTTLQPIAAPGITAFVVKGTILLLLGWLVTVLLRRAPAGARHALWLTAIVGVVLIPVLAQFASVRLAVLPVAKTSALATPVVRDSLDVTTATAASVAISERNSQPGVAPATMSAPSQSGVTSLAIGLWLAVSAVVVAWLVTGVATVRRVLHRARILESPDWTRSLLDATQTLMITRHPRLLMSDEVETAFACGILRPTIVLPRSADEWPDDRRRAVLLHEAAHIRRRDLVGHIIASVGCAIYWFHPMMWVAAHRLRAESELACDDMVLDAGVRPSDYAQHLLDLVTGIGGRSGAPALALPMVRSQAFEGRMQAILERANRWKLGHGERGLVIGLFALLTVSIAAVAPVPRPAVIQPLSGRPPLARPISDSVIPGQLTGQPVRRATLTRVFVGGETRRTAARAQSDSLARRARRLDSATSASPVALPAPMLASTPCQRAVGAQQVPWVVDTAYARLFDGIRMTTGQENRACEVLLRLHFEQLAADSISEQAVQLMRIKLLALQTQRNALLRGLLTNESDRATLDARAQEVGLGAGALRSPMDWSSAQRGGGAGGGARGRAGGGAAAVLDSVILRGGGAGGGMRGRAGGGAAPVLDSLLLRGGGGGRMGRGRGGAPIDSAAAANLAVMIVDIGARMTFQRLFEGIALTDDQKAAALEIIRAAEQEARTSAPPRRLVRLRIAPVPGVVTMNGAGIEDLKAILSSDTDRATLQSRIIVAPR